MCPTVNSRIKFLDAKILVLYAESKGMATEHNSSVE